MFNSNNNINILKMNASSSPSLNTTSSPSLNNRRVCCRLCLAPDNECVSIFTTSAADKEPLSSKILSCVRIKVHEQDRLSPKICHACISYLNSWQSFKNRCDTAQRKQRSWLGLMPQSNSDKNALQQMLNKPNITIQTLQQKQREQQLHQHLLQQHQQQQPNQQHLKFQQQLQLRQQLQQRGILIRENGDQRHDAIRQQLNGGPQKSTSSSGVEVTFIKSEPHEEADDEDRNDVVMDIDPTQFLAQEDDDDYNNDNDDQKMDHVENGEGPSILTSLGLTHIKVANQYSYQNSENDYGGDDSNPEDDKSAILNMLSNQFGLDPSNMQMGIASCSICDMKFSNRANARRHERNIHGVILNPLNAPTNSQPSTPQPPPLMPSITSPPDVKPRMKMKFKPPPEVYDYSDPAKYRHLVTPNKLAFILRNLDFLEQAQDMHCKCCNKIFPSYKYFMGHMRKKFHHLPRNVCFKCLRQFTSKGQFIGHLKRKSCINLYNVVMADDTIPKDPPPSPVKDPNRPGTKDIIANKTYGCKLCSKTFRLKNDFRQHVYEEHAEIQRSKEIPGASCAYCNATFDDSQVRRRHYNNLDCIVFIICGTCEDRFESHTNYIDHVYQTHLTQQLNGTHDEYGYDLFDQDANSPTSHLRNPQNCPVCNKQYNNYYNVLRHMESKHPNQLPQIYQCQKCEEGFPRQSELREHLQNVHGEMVVRQQKQQQIQQHFQLIQQQNKINFTCKQCEHSSTNLTDWIEHQHIEHAKFVCTKCPFVGEDRDEFAQHCLTEHNNFSLNNLKVKFYSCTKCTNSYSTSQGLKEHLVQDHGMNPMELDESLNESIEETDKSTITPGFDIRNNLHTILANAMAIKNEKEPSPSPLMVSLTNGPETSGQISCRLCNRRMNDNAELRRHMAEAHGMENKFVGCNICQAKFMNDKGLKVHLFRVHGIREEVAAPAVATATTAVVAAPAPVPALTLIAKPQQTLISLPEIKVECKICHIVYKNEEQLRMHTATVHNTSGVNESAANTSHQAADIATIQQHIVEPETADVKPQVMIVQQPVLWFQCRYCNESFNTSKKLTLHMNTHNEIDQTDYTCKDCGNVYISKKSLWVHRHKKHPRIADASLCDVCKKVFFDKTELYYHIQTHSQQELYSTPQVHNDKLSNGSVADGHLECHVCNLKFNDNELLNKHIRIHEMQNNMFNPTNVLFSFLDASAGSQGSFVKQEMKEAEYKCDMCPKTFPILNALQVHRGWHFRSPDGRKVRDPNDMWQPDQLPPSKIKRMMNSSRGGTVAVATSLATTNVVGGGGVGGVGGIGGGPGASVASTPPTCPYCQATFASGNNLRRHIVEIHKRNESKLQREQNNSPTVFVEKVRECAACSATFKTTSEWIDHKIMHARSQKPSQTFEWNCEVCGKMFTRKERLLAHMITHLNSKEFDEENPYVNNPNLTHDDSNSQSQYENSQSSVSSATLERQSLEQQELDIKQEHIDIEPDNIHEENDNEEEIEEEEDEADDDDDDEEPSHSEPQQMHQEDANGGYSCQLCQVYFESANELRQHVSEHFVNGGMSTNNVQSNRPANTNPNISSNSNSNSNSSSSSSDSSDSSESSAPSTNNNVRPFDISNNQQDCKCRYCGSAFDDAHAMLLCMRSHQIPTNLKCGDCQLYFTSAKQFGDHESIYHPKGGFVV